MICHIRHGMPDVAYADKTRHRRISQPARALDVGCGVTALSDLRGAALHSSLANYRVVNFLFRLPDAVFHIHIVWRIHHDRQLAVVTQHSSIAQIRGDKFLLFFAIRAGHHRGNRGTDFIKDIIIIAPAFQRFAFQLPAETMQIAIDFQRLAD